MSVLLDDFRPRTLMPDHYDSKQRFWEELIEAYCYQKGDSKITLKELKSAFSRNGIKPFCLSEVLENMKYSRNLVEKHEFMQKPADSLTGWAFSSLSWSFGKIKEKLANTQKNDEVVYICKSAVEYQSRRLLEQIRDVHTNNGIISLDDLMQYVRDFEGIKREGLYFLFKSKSNNKTVPLLGVITALHYLSSTERSVYMEELLDSNSPSHHHKILLKFADTDQPVSPITEIERASYNLEQTEKFLLDAIDKKEIVLNDVLKQVKDCVRDGKKQLAKTFLRKKHLLEADLVKSHGVLENVQVMLQTVRSSRSDREVLSCYKMGSDAIKSAFAEAGVNLDNVSDIIEEMQEVFTNQAECESAISEPMRGQNYDDAELEQELLDLMKSDTNSKHSPEGGNPSTLKEAVDMDNLDRELEMRLQRLRSDFDDDDISVQKPHSVTTKLFQ